MADLLDAAREIDDYCRRREWRYCIIGGMALLRWGEQRMTKDVDITLLTGFGGEERFVRALLSDFEPLVPNAADFALRNRVLPLRTKAGFKADIALGALPFEEQAVTRATDYAFAEDVSLRVCSAEDLVVMKAFAARPQDWIDIEGIAIRQHGACAKCCARRVHPATRPRVGTAARESEVPAIDEGSRGARGDKQFDFDCTVGKGKPCSLPSRAKVRLSSRHPCAADCG